MSFGESVFSAGFIQKTVKGDLFIKENYRIPLQNRRGKTLEHSRRQITEAKTEALSGGAKPTYRLSGPRAHLSASAS